MRKAVVVVLLSVLPVRGAPIPESSRLPRQKLDALAKRLPKVLEDKDWQEHLAALGKILVSKIGPITGFGNLEVKLVRRIGPAEAKIRLRLPAKGSRGKQLPTEDIWWVIHLRYYDGLWTTTSVDSSLAPNFAGAAGAGHYLMHLLDEAAAESARP